MLDLALRAIPISWLLIALLLGGCSLPASLARPTSGVATPVPSPQPVSAPADELPALGPADVAEFESISLEQGLSQSVVSTILQDRQGFLWFGTQDGLNRYDGYEFAIYKHDPADPTTLSDNFIQAIHEDASGNLWIGTHGGGVNRYDPGSRQFTALRHDPGDPATISHNNVLKILGGRDGRLWIGTAAGLNRLDPLTLQVTRYPHGGDDPADPSSMSGSSVQAILEDRQGMVWVGTFDGGLNRLDPQTGRFQVYRKDAADPDSLPDDTVQALLEDRAGNLWIGTAAGGLARLDRGTGRFVRYQHDPGDETSLASNNVTALFEDRSGNLWIGTTNGGLDRFDRDSGRFIHHQPRPDDPHSLSNPTVQSLYEDRGGILWVGTFGGGVNKYDSYARKFTHHQHNPDDPASLSSNMIWSFAQDPDGSIWIATVDAGLDRFDPASGAFTHYRNIPSDPTSLASDQVWSAFVDRSGGLWVGTAAGLDRFDAASRSFAHFPAPAVFGMMEDEGGVLWLATGGGGLGRLDRATGEIAYYQNDPASPTSISADFLTSVFEDRDGRLWVGAFDSGLNRLDDLSARPGEAQFIRFRNDPEDPGSLIHDTVLDIHQDRNGVLWVATAGGLDRMDSETGRFTHFGVKEGLANELIYAILEDDDGNLWLSTNRGLARFDPVTGAIRNYTPRDGLQSNEFNQGAALGTSDGLMYFGGINGFNVFDPAKVRDRGYTPPIVVTRFDLFNEPVPIAEDSPLRQAIDRTSLIKLSHAQDFLSFEFAALDYAAPDLNQYAYMMEGLDRDWNYVGARRFAGYTNVPPGEYSFRVKATNSDGVWNEAGATLGLVVTPPFWQTWWFRAGVMLALAGGIVGVYSLRVRSLEARSRELEAQVEKRTHEIERRQQELGALYRADEELYSHLEVDEVFAALTEIAVHVLRADRSAVMTWDHVHQRPLVRAAHGFTPDDLDRLAEMGSGPAEQVARTGRPVMISDDEERAAEGQPAGLRASMHLPIRVMNDVFGVFCVGYEAPHVFSDEEQRLFLALAQRAAIAIENARHFDDEHRRAEQFRVINEVGQRMNAILPLDELLQQLAVMIQEAFTDSHVGIGIIEGEEIVARAEHGVFGQAYEGLRLRLDEDSLWSWVAENGEPLLLSDVHLDPSFRGLAGAYEIRSLICVPLRAAEGVIGVLSIASERPDAFDEGDLVVLQALANQAATAIENARLYEQGQQDAVLEERSRLARDLHDAVTQNLFSASLIAEALPAIWEADPQEGAQLLRELRQLSRGALAEMRTLLLELRPTALADARLPDLLRQLAEAASGRMGVPVPVTVEGRCELPETVRVTLYRIAQEALNNVVKHSHASQVSLSLKCREAPGASDAAAVELSICDNGCGFDLENAPLDHLGLGIIRERAQAVGAELQITSRPGAGAAVTVCWRGET